MAGAGDVGCALVEDERGGVAFTGSVETGKAVRRLMRSGSRMNLEMGGKDPFIVCADVAADEAAARRPGRHT